MSVGVAPAAVLVVLAALAPAHTVPVSASASASASAPAASAASDEDEALLSYLRAGPRGTDVAEAAAVAASMADGGGLFGGGVFGGASDRSSGSLAVWEPAQPDPRWYLLTEADAAQARRRERQGGVSAEYRPTDATDEEIRRRPTEHKRAGPSLSIVNPLDVLRQRILLEIARRRIKQSEGQIQANRDLLRVIGKRSRWQ